MSECNILLVVLIIATVAIFAGIYFSTRSTQPFTQFNPKELSPGISVPLDTLEKPPPKKRVSFEPINGDVPTFAEL